MRNNEQTIFPLSEELPESILKQLNPDQGFISEEGRNYDLSWQAVYKGFIGSGKTYSGYEPIPLKDEYRFSRKYFSSFWVFYLMLYRILSFNNPFNELRAWIQTRHTPRADLYSNPISYATWETFQSTLLQRQPRVTVVIPTLNRYRYLKDAIKDLEAQTYKNFEVVVVDQSEPFQKDQYESFELDLKVVEQEEKALWLARNNAIKNSDSELLLLFDDDSRVDPDWIENHIKAIDFFKADISSGVSISKVGAEIPRHYGYFKVSDQLDTGNAMIKREVFNAIGLFDRQFEKMRMGDGEFGCRAFINGFLNISNPYAGRIHLKVDSGGLREMGSWDAFRTSKWFAPRPIPSVLYFFRRYFGNKQAKRAIMRIVPFSIIPYSMKKNKGLLIIGALLSILLSPILLLQIGKSWRLSTIKLKEGPKIEQLINDNP